MRWFGTIFVTMSLLPILGTALWFWLSAKKELWRIDGAAPSSP
jgi:hypothetical protein